MADHSRQLNPELHRWLEARQKSLTIVKTTKTLSGQIVDWVPVKSQVPGGKIASPAPAMFLPVCTEDKHHPVQAARFELDDPEIWYGGSAGPRHVREMNAYKRLVVPPIPLF